MGAKGVVGEILKWYRWVSIKMPTVTLKTLKTTCDKNLSLRKKPTVNRCNGYPGGVRNNYKIMCRKEGECVKRRTGGIMTKQQFPINYNYKNNTDNQNDHKDTNNHNNNNNNHINFINNNNNNNNNNREQYNNRFSTGKMEFFCHCGA